MCVWKGFIVFTGRGRLCVYKRGGVCVHGEREDVCIWKGGVSARDVYGSFGVSALGEGLYMEGLECVCTRRGCVYRRG